MVRNTAAKVSQMRRMGVPAANESVTDRFRCEARSSGNAIDKWMQITKYKYKMKIQNPNPKHKYKVQG